MIMPQHVLPFKYEMEKKEKNLTGLAGLLLYLELFTAIKLHRIITQNVTVRKDKEGYSDEQVVLALILLNLAGGSSVSDIEQLEKDEGFCRILKAMELKGTFGRIREKIQKEWEKKHKNTVASPSSIFRYLAHFHNPEEEEKREKGKAFIPEPNEYLKSLNNVNYELIDFAQIRNPQTIATFDMDATLAESFKKQALFCYKGYSAYQPFNVWWAEHEMIMFSEFRDGNVNAGFDQLRILIECLLNLPLDVEKVYVRSDSAGYQYEFLRYCNEGKNERFGKIYFAISNDMTPEFKKAVYDDKDLKWKPIYKKLPDGRKIESGQEWAEVCFVPKELCSSKNSPDYRYIAIREELKQEVFPEMKDQLELPFPTIELKQIRYKLTGLVTNIDGDGEAIIHWHRERCGKSEAIHSVMKDDLAGGRFPSGDFGRNAAWWLIMILSLNLQSIMRQYVLGGKLKNKRMKCIRFRIINIPAKILERDGMFTVRIASGHPSFDLLNTARERIRELACLPAG
jgi:hypothetical protein